MKLIQAITSGIIRSIRSYKAVLLIWLITFLLLSLLSVPLKNLLVQLNGNSMSTELLKEGFNISYWVELNKGLASIGSLAGMGTLIALLLFQLVNVFLFGGLFDSLRSNRSGFKASGFFGSGARLFGSYFVANMLVFLMILASAGLIIGLPVVIVRGTESAGETTMFNVLKYIRIVFIVALLICLLVLDYARAWLAANDHSKVFKALGYGFRATFSSFLASLLFMAVVVTIQVLFLWGGIKLIDMFNPQKGGGLFLLFLLSQALFILKLFLRAWRYGGITELYEL